MNQTGLTKSTSSGILMLEEQKEVCNVTELGIALRKIRLDKHELLREMAAKLNVSSAFLSAVETGKKRPPANFVNKISDLYDLSSSEKEELLHAAEMSLDEVRINLSGASSAQHQAAISFAKALNGLTDEEVSKIMCVFSQRKNKR